MKSLGNSMIQFEAAMLRLRFCACSSVSERYFILQIYFIPIQVILGQGNCSVCTPRTVFLIVDTISLIWQFIKGTLMQI